MDTVIAICACVYVAVAFILSCGCNAEKFKTSPAGPPASLGIFIVCAVWPVSLFVWWFCSEDF